MMRRDIMKRYWKNVYQDDEGQLWLMEKEFLGFTNLIVGKPKWTNLNKLAYEKIEKMREREKR